MGREQEIVTRARACVGARFRAHGRSIDHGLDCVGVAAMAFGRPVPAAYPMRGGTAEAVARAVADAGLRAVAGPPAPADLVLIDAGTGQLHLAVLVPGGFVHADARLRRVVETPGVPARVIAAWRKEDD